MTLVLGEIHRDQIISHLEQAYPDEGCGILVGWGGREWRRVDWIKPVDNHAGSDRAHRYVIDPEAFLAVEKRARLEGLEVLGFYHSHPDHAAEPSATDRAEAFSHYDYVIAAVRSGRVEDMRVWRFDPDTGFAPGTLEVVGGAE